MTVNRAKLLELCKLYVDGEIYDGHEFEAIEEYIAALVSSARRDERERCARVCDSISNKDDEYCGSVSIYDAHACAAAIRALPENDEATDEH